MGALSVEPEMGALLATRRWLVLVAMGAAWLLTAAFGAATWSSTSALEHAVLLVSGLLVVAGILLSGRSWALWLAVGGVGLLIVAPALSPAASPAWIPLGTMAGYLTYVAVTLFSRAWGLVVAVAGATLLALVWQGRPANVIPGGLAAVGGWVQVALVLSGALAMWLAWNALVSEAQVADARLRKLDRQTADAIAVQERARLWRETGSRLHELVLNSVRYVMLARDVDRDRLAGELALEVAGREHLDVDSRVSVAGAIEAALHGDSAGQAVRVVGPVPDIELSNEVFDAVRAAVLELIRNCLRHGQASEVHIEVSGSHEAVEIQVADNGLGVSPDSRAGVGTAKVLVAALADVGGTWQFDTVPGEHGYRSTIRVPARGASTYLSVTDQPFDKGRLLVTAPLAGLVAVGAAYFAGLVELPGIGRDLAIVAGIAGCVAAVWTVVRRRRLAPAVSVPLALVPALVPWLLLGGSVACIESGSVSRSINIAGFSIMILVAWGGWWTAAVALPVWALGGIVLAAQLPAGCRGFLLIALVNSVLALPVILAITSAGARAYRVAQDQSRLAIQREIAASSRASAAVDISTQLEGTVAEAIRLLGTIAAGAEADAGMRRELELVDGRIRAGIQVDPLSDGAFAVLAKSLVDDASRIGRSVNVRSITASADRRELPLPVQRTVYRLLAASGDVVPVIQAFSDGKEDHLSLVVTRSGLRDAGLLPGETRVVDDVSIEVDDDLASGDADHDYAVLVSRRVSRE
ncbi:MAG: hypothetical protein NTX29_10910 [Actinobacteria bacterium]|nr:hypothetical protein [Actinomycetota bacterium]